MTWLRKLIQKCHYLRAFAIWVQHMPSDERPAWANSDVENLKNFLNTDTGRRLNERLFFECHVQDRTIVQRGEGHAYAAGWCGGVRAMHASFLSLTTIEPAQAARPATTGGNAQINGGTSESEAGGADDLRNRMAPA